MPDFADVDWLRDRIESGATVNEVAAEIHRDPRSVRHALRQHGIPSPRARRQASIDLDEVFDLYHRGVPVVEIAATLDVGVDWVRARVKAHGIIRDQPVRRRRPPSKYPELDDPDWLRRQLAEGGLTRIARSLGTSPANVRAALRRHEIPIPPRTRDRLQRLTATSDPVIRYQAAAKLAAEAQQLLDAARAVQDSAVEEMAASGLSRAEVRRRLGAP